MHRRLGCLHYARLALGLALIFALAPGSAAHVAAYTTWCFDDPIVSVDGPLVDIQVQMPRERVATMRSTTLTIIIPKNTTGAVVVDDVSAFPMHTTISPSGPKWDGSGSLPIRIVVEVAADTDYDIRVVGTPLSALGVSLGSATMAMGRTNIPLRMGMQLPP